MIIIIRNIFTIAGNNKKIWEELIAYFSLIRYGLHRKRKHGGRDSKVIS
jgi:hypothetical protein